MLRAEQIKAIAYEKAISEQMQSFISEAEKLPDKTLGKTLGILNALRKTYNLKEY